MKTNRAHLRPQITGEFVFPVDGCGSRCGLAVAELAHGFAQLIDLKSEIKIERRITCFGHVRHGQQGEGCSGYRPRGPNTSSREDWSNGVMGTPDLKRIALCG